MYTKIISRLLGLVVSELTDSQLGLHPRRLSAHRQLVFVVYYFPPVIQMYTKFSKFARLYFTEQFTYQTLQFYYVYRMLFQDVVIFLPVSNFFKISSKRLKVHLSRIILPIHCATIRLINVRSQEAKHFRSLAAIYIHTNLYHSTFT